MKKIIALVLCLVLLAGCALAETADKQQLGTVSMNGVFELRCALPESYRVSVLEEDSAQYHALIYTDEPGKPVMSLMIVYDELLESVERLNDLDETALGQIADTFRQEDQVDISYEETAHGTKLMVVREAEDAVDYVVFYTIYKGYEIEFVLSGDGTGSGVGLTGEQIRMAVDFLSDLDFVPAE